MTIVHIDTGQTLRGGQRQLLRLARGLAGCGHAQTIVCPEGSGLEARAQEEGHRVFPLAAHDLGYAHGIFQLRQRLLAAPAEILHAHDGRSQTTSWLASWGLATRRVASRRVAFLPSALMRHRFVYRRTCHAVIAVSQFVKSLLIGSGVPAGRIEVIPDGIETPSTLPTPEQRARAREKWGLRADDFVAGQLGASTPEKGQDIAAQAMSGLTDPLPQSRLLVVGDAPLAARENLLRLAGDAGPRVQLVNDLEDLSPFLAAIDVLVMPSRSEGLGSAALLALAHGRPVIASRVGGLPEVVEDAISGWLIPPESPEALRQTILHAALEPARLHQMGLAARERAREFSTDIMVARTEKLYLQLAATGPGE